jgi:hypothetical protein
MPVVTTFSNFFASENLAEVVNGVCRRTGIPQSNDPAGSTDPLYAQIIAHVNDANNEIYGDYKWRPLVVTGEITIFADAPGQKEKAFDFPVDFQYFVDQTQWNNSTQLPAMGPVSDQSWRMYNVRNWVPQLTFFWQLRGGKLWVLNPPYVTDVAARPKFSFMYVSGATVIDGDDPSQLKNYASKNGDTFILDGLSILLLGRVKFLAAKGFDSAAAELDYQRRIEQIIDQSVAAPVLTLARDVQFPYLGLANLPDTGYGRGPM